MPTLMVALPAKTVPEMTYNVFSGTLNPTHPCPAEHRWRPLFNAAKFG